MQPLTKNTFSLQHFHNHPCVLLTSLHQNLVCIKCVRHKFILYNHFSINHEFNVNDKCSPRSLASGDFAGTPC